MYTYIFVYIYIYYLVLLYNFKRGLKCPIYSITPEPWLVHIFEGNSRRDETKHISKRAKYRLKEKGRESINRRQISIIFRDSFRGPFLLLFVSRNT